MKENRLMNFFSRFSVFFNKTCCFWGLFHPFLTQRIVIVVQHSTHTHTLYIYNNEQNGIVSCKYGIVFSRFYRERREKMFALRVSLTLSIRFFFSLRVFDDE